MKTKIIPLLILCINIFTVNTYAQLCDTIGTVDMKKFDYGLVDKYGSRFIQNGWLIDISRATMTYKEFAPANECFWIYTEFYPDGIIKRRFHAFGNVIFGCMELYDLNGNIERVVDEDLKFGKIKWTDIRDLIEKEGWINRETGENKILPRQPILPTDGNFYYKLFGFGNIIDVGYVPSEDESDIGYWYVTIPSDAPNWVETTYKINGETGEFEKTEKDSFRYE